MKNNIYSLETKNITALCEDIRALTRNVADLSDRVADIGKQVSLLGVQVGSLKNIIITLAIPLCIGLLLLTIQLLLTIIFK